RRLAELYAAPNEHGQLGKRAAACARNPFRRRVTRDASARRLLPEDREQKRQHERDDDAGDDRKVKRESFALDVNVAGQSAEAELREPRPAEADDQKCRPQNDEKTLHRATSRRVVSPSAFV